MKKTSIAVLAVAALALAGTQAAFADDNNQGKAKGKTTQLLVEATGTIKALAAPSITVTLKTASMSDKTRAVAQAMLRAGVVTFGTDTNTVFKRGTANTFASLAVGDKVELRAKCTLTPLTCVATRVIAAPAPTPKPAPLHLGFALEGVVTGNSGSALTVVVVRASAGDDNPLKPKSILGTAFNVLADTSTAVVKAGVTTTGLAAVATVTPYAAVNVSGTCASTLPIVCTAKRITVIVPTA
jgi:hypothetical protein